MVKKTVLNFENNNNMSGEYPLFLGDSLGFSDEINITFTDIDKQFKKQRSAFWLETEFSFEQDRIDLMEAPTSEKDVMVLNLLAQWALDSMASRSIIEILGPFCSNNELHNWFLTQSFFEAIHAATYSKIVRNCFSDSNAVLERGKSNLEVFNRCKRIGEVMNKTAEYAGLYSAGVIPNEEITITDIEKQIFKAVATLYALEQISFMSSFAATFALVSTDRYQSIGKAVGAILADEKLHAEGDLIVLKHMIRKSSSVYESVKDEIQEIVDDIVQQEIDWGTYMFSEGRKILGYNEQLSHEYTAWVAKPCYNELELQWDSDKFLEQPSKNPLPFMDEYGDRDKIQNANQEIENNNYRVGQVDDDLDSGELDFL